MTQVMHRVVATDDSSDVLYTFWFRWYIFLLTVRVFRGTLVLAVVVLVV